MKYLSQNGFTTKELVGVVLIISLLSSISVPLFYMLKTSQLESEMEIVVKQIQTKLARLKKESVALPLALDLEATQHYCKSCFDLVLGDGVENKLWYKNSGLEYFFSTNGNHTQLENYKEVGDFKITYDSTTGKILSEEIR